MAVGEYLCSEHDLYRVEQIEGSHALIEDCRTGALIDTPLRDLAHLSRVDRR